MNGGMIKGYIGIQRRSMDLIGSIWMSMDTQRGFQCGLLDISLNNFQ